MIEIYVVTHKEYDFPKYNIYKPIIAGAFEYQQDKFPANYIRDDKLINISYKHDLYSEYTVTYWIWKNSTADVVGLNHYRRYFIRGGWISYLLCLVDPAKRKNRYVINDDDINVMFYREGIECILPKKQWRVNRTLKQEFLSTDSKGLFSVTEKIIKDFYPDYYSWFIRVFDSRENHQKCICVMTKHRYDEYCQWIFSIFEKLEESGFGGKKREFAFLGERLINVWAEKKRHEDSLKVKELFFINTEFSFRGIKKNHTELFIPQIIRLFLRLITGFGLEMVIDHEKGGIKIQKRKEKL